MRSSLNWQAQVVIRSQLAVLLVGVFIWMFMSKVIPLSLGALLASGTLIITLTPLTIKFVHSKFDIFEPIVPASLMLALLFGVRPLAMIVTGNTDFYRWHDISEYFVEAVALGFVGSAFFLIGYATSFPKKTFIKTKRVRQKESPRRISCSIVHILCIIAGFFSLLLFATYLSSSGSLWDTLQLMARGRSVELESQLYIKSEYLSAAPILSACVAIILLAIPRSKHFPNVRRLLILIAITYPVIVFLFVGVRRFIIPSIVIPVGVYYLTTQKRPSAKFLAIVFAICLMILAAIPYIRTETAREQLGKISGSLYYALKGRLLWEHLLLGYDTEMLPALAVELSILNMPCDVFYGKATVGDLLLAPVPSAILPGKPVTARNEMLIMCFGSPCDASPGGLCPDFSVIGTFYQDFWYAGVIGGMFILGAASRRIWRRYVINKTNPFAVIMAACWSVFIPIIIRAGFMPAFAWYLYFLLPCLFVLWIASKLKIFPLNNGVGRLDNG